MQTKLLKRCLVECVQAAGTILASRFGKISSSRRKENRTSIVCQADLAAEDRIIRHIRSLFPSHGIIAEESGCQTGRDEFTWVIDPLDGTSNYVAGIPWFGVQIGLLRGATPVMGAIYLPVTDTLYLTEAGRGVFRNRRRVYLTAERELANVLCAFGMDAAGGNKENLANARLLARIAGAVRNIRTTNSLMDFCYTIDGRLGACINLNTKLWDILPAHLMVQEAGGRFTDLFGGELNFEMTPQNFDRNFAILAARAGLHTKLLALTKAHRASLQAGERQT